MVITEKDSSKFKKLLEMAASQEKLIEEISITAKDGFKTNRLYVLEKEGWPEAVNNVLIIDRQSESDKIVRAKAICNFLLPDCKGKKVLDFGCGEGHVANEVKNREAERALGYDIKKQWVEDPILTLEEKVVELHAPYDYILAFDVLDHLENDNPVEVLKKLKKWCKGDIIIRFHPWCSRHATHSYYDVNKAFAHMFLTEAEMKEAGIECLPSAKVVHPIKTYREWINKAGLKVISEDIIREPVEGFFRQFAGIIKTHWRDSHEIDLANGSKFPNFQMEQQFLDYVLRG